MWFESQLFDIFSVLIVKSSDAMTPVEYFMNKFLYSRRPSDFRGVLSEFSNNFDRL